MKQKQFLYIDLSGRGYNAPYTYSEMLRWKLFNYVDINTEFLLSDWIDDCYVGDKFKTNSIEIICIQ